MVLTDTQGRFYIPADSSDPVVAMTALKAGRILVTRDAGRLLSMTFLT